MNTVSIIGYSSKSSESHQHVTARTKEAAINELAKKTCSHFSHAELFLAYSTSLQFYFRPDHKSERFTPELSLELITHASFAMEKDKARLTK